MIKIYSIQFPAAINMDDFVGLFYDLNSDGVEEKDNSLDVYLKEEQISQGEDFIGEICSRYQTTFTVTELENKNWNEQWESNFQPIILDDFVYVRATFHKPDNSVQYEIIIEPKMSFGTGHHSTTFQMMQNMRLLDFKNKNVLDCGSGTGILAVLAEKLGANKCIALDNDDWCFKNCNENIQLNNAENVRPVIGDLDTLGDEQYDIILANIHRNFLLDNMNKLAAMTMQDGFIIVSGFFAEDTKLILDAALEHHLIVNYRTTRQNWDCIVLQKKEK